MALLTRPLATLLPWLLPVIVATFEITLPAQTLGAAASPVPGLPVIGQRVPYNVALRGMANLMPVAGPVAEMLVFKDVASHIQLHFDQVCLPEGTWIEIQSILDGDAQRIDASQVVDGCTSSAFFNGWAVRVRLWGEPGCHAPSVRICALDLGLGALGEAASPLPAPTASCSTDGRVATATRPVCRLLLTDGRYTYWCSAWLVSKTTSAHVTAGHCFGTVTVTGWMVEYNVPLSSSGGTPRHPPVADQYPGRFATYLNGAPGNDWALFTVQGNPYKRQQKYFQLGTPSTNRTVRMRGYGTSSPQISLTLNLAQKGDTGKLSAVVGSLLQYSLYSSGGDSGGPIYWVDDSDGYHAVGIVTGNGCATVGYNVGTSTTNAGFRKVYDRFTR